MATTVARPNSLPVVASGVAVATAIVAAGNSDVADRRALTGPADLVVTYTDTGGSQSVVVDIQGSADGTNYWNIPYALIATPSTFVVSSITYNTGGGGVVHYLLQGGQPWRYLRLTTSSQVAMTVDARAYFFPA